MTIEKAVEDLLNSEEFKADARQDAKLRVFIGRYRKGTVGNGAAIELLLRYGYTIEVKKKRITVKK